MMSGDGLGPGKPAYGRLTGAGLAVLADFVDQFGNGVVDLTSRANLQIRGVSEQAYPALLSALQAAGLAGSSQKKLNSSTLRLLRLQTRTQLAGDVQNVFMLLLTICLTFRRNSALY